MTRKDLDLLPIISIPYDTFLNGNINVKTLVQLVRYCWVKNRWLIWIIKGLEIKLNKHFGNNTHNIALLLSFPFYRCVVEMFEIFLVMRGETST